MVAHNQKLLDKIDKANNSIELFERNISLLRQNHKNVFINVCLNKDNYIFADEFVKYINSLNVNGYSYSYIYEETNDHQYKKRLYDPKKTMLPISDFSFFHNREHHPCLFGKISVFPDGDMSLCWV